MRRERFERGVVSRWREQSDERELGASIGERLRRRVLSDLACAGGLGSAKLREPE